MGYDSNFGSVFQITFDFYDETPESEELFRGMIFDQFPWFINRAATLWCLYLARHQRRSFAVNG